MCHSRLFEKLSRRGIPAYIIQLLKSWNSQQRLFVKLGNAVSDVFLMTNGIRQGSIMRPHLFNIYVDGFNLLLSNSKIGCHIGGIPLNNFSYADDLAILAPSARALNKLLSICDEFVRKNIIEFSAAKSVVLLILPKTFKLVTEPNIYLGKSFSPM